MKKWYVIILSIQPSNRNQVLVNAQLSPAFDNEEFAKAEQVTLYGEQPLPPPEIMQYVCRIIQATPEEARQ